MDKNVHEELHFLLLQIQIWSQQAFSKNGNQNGWLIIHSLAGKEGIYPKDIQGPTKNICI